jgi:hypothetical protein
MTRSVLQGPTISMDFPITTDLSASWQRGVHCESGIFTNIGGRAIASWTGSRAAGQTGLPKKNDRGHDTGFAVVAVLNLIIRGRRSSVPHSN